MRKRADLDPARRALDDPRVSTYDRAGGQGRNIVGEPHAVEAGAQLAFYTGDITRSERNGMLTDLLS